MPPPLGVSSGMDLERVMPVGDFWATITSNGSPYAMRRLSCLSVTLVYCGQTVG